MRSPEVKGASVNGKTPVIQYDSKTLLPGCQLQAVGERKKSGLILCKDHHAEFAGPGAVVGSPVEQGYKAIIAVGSPELVPISTYEERQRAYSRRIQWTRWLQSITDQPDASLRVEKLLSNFEEFFDRQVIAALPDEVLAALIGVLPQTVQAVRLQYYGSTSARRGKFWKEQPRMTSSTEAIAANAAASPVANQRETETTHNFYHSGFKVHQLTESWTASPLFAAAYSSGR